MLFNGMFNTAYNYIGFSLASNFVHDFFFILVGSISNSTLNLCISSIHINMEWVVLPVVHGTTLETITSCSLCALQVLEHFTEPKVWFDFIKSKWGTG